MRNNDGAWTLPEATAIVDTLPIGLALIDAHGQFLYVNKELERATGYAQGELLGQPVETLIPSRLHTQHAAERDAYMRAPATRYMGVGRELFARRKDGGEFPVEVGLRPIALAVGQAVLATVIDVTERRQVESNFRAIIDAAPSGMLLMDEHGRIAMINQKLLDIFEYRQDELVGQHIEILLPDRQRSHHVSLRDSFLQAPMQRAMGKGRDLAGRRKDGVEIPVEIGLSSIVTPKGRMALATVVDITDRKRAELELQEANAQLEEFSYVSSHDLRSPIRGISNLIDFIREDYGETAPEAVLKNLTRMQERIARMERLIEDLLTYARAGKRSAKVERIDLREIVDAMTKLEPPPPQMELSADLNAQPFDGARTPLATVMRNLYSNAIKHHDRPDGSLKIKAAENGRFCVIDMIDDGPGIPENARTRIFRLFQTLTASERKGSGLGLAVAKRLAEGHGGKIEFVANDAQRGSTFRIWWPRFMRSDLDE